MIPFLTCLALALAAPQDGFKRAVSSADAAKVLEAGEKLATAGSKPAVTALLDGHETCTANIRKLWSKKTSAIRSMKSSAGFRINAMTNPPSIARGDESTFRRFRAAEKSGARTEEEIMAWEACRRAIAEALRKVPAGEGADEMARQLVEHESWEVRTALARTASGPALVKAANEDAEAQVRLAAIESLDAAGEATAEIVDALIDRLADEAWQVRYAAASALASLKIREAAGPLVDAMGTTHGRLRHELSAALTRLTGVDKHGDPAAWKAWWEANSAAFLDGTYVPAPGEKAGPGPKMRTTFYGIPIKSRNVVFILDGSGSMVAPSGIEIPEDTEPSPDPAVRKRGNKKIDIARWQLKRALAMLPDGTRFNIIFYNHAGKALSKHHLLGLDARTRKRAYAFIDSVVPMGPTNIYDPLEEGMATAGKGRYGELLAKSGVDTIFFLTDGIPNGGQVPEAKDILVKVRELNACRKIKIHTIGVFGKIVGPAALNAELYDGSRFLQQLAVDSGGTYTGPRVDGK